MKTSRPRKNVRIPGPSHTFVSLRAIRRNIYDFHEIEEAWDNADIPEVLFPANTISISISSVSFPITEAVTTFWKN